MEANARDVSFDTPYVAGALVLGALVLLVLMNRVVANVNIGLK